VAYKKFVFLQHGITYLKSQTKKSSYVRGKEASPDYMVVSSEKEAVVVSKMLKIPQNNLLKTGMVVFDNITRNHLLSGPQDNILIMFTWRYLDGDSLLSVKDSVLYKMMSDVLDILSSITHDCSVKVCVHPKIRSLLQSLPGDNIEFYEGDISNVLATSNLVITDYSSIAYNSFYRGAGVIFYQPDLVEYEESVGPLIPEEGEYVGYRVGSKDSLEEVIRGGIKERGIDINYFRREEFITRYELINEFSDKGAKQRVVSELKALCLI
jgi:hypothetical protein